MQMGKEDLPRREGRRGQVCNTFCSQEMLESWYFLTLECSHLLAGLCSISEKENLFRIFAMTVWVLLRLNQAVSSRADL